MAVQLNKTEAFSNLTGIVKKGIEESNNKLIKDIPLEYIEENPDNKKVFSLDNIEGLMESIKNNGFTGAIDVYKLGENRYQILSGHRRYEAVKQLSLKTIPCIISEPDSNILTRKKLIDSNINTRTLSPIELAHAIDYYENTLREENFKGNINKKLSEIFTLSETKIYQLKSLLKMTNGIQDLAKSITFPYESFSEAVTFPADYQQKLVKLIKDYLNSYPDAGLPSIIVQQYINEVKKDIQNERTQKRRDKVIESLTPETLSKIAVTLEQKNNEEVTTDDNNENNNEEEKPTQKFAEIGQHSTPELSNKFNNSLFEDDFINITENKSFPEDIQIAEDDSDVYKIEITPDEIQKKVLNYIDDATNIIRKNRAKISNENKKKYIKQLEELIKIIQEI